MRVKAVGAQQLLVRSHRMNAATLHHDDPVGVVHGRQPVRDHERGAAVREPLQRRRDLALALGVERTRRLVEQQDRPVGQQRPRD